MTHKSEHLFHIPHLNKNSQYIYTKYSKSPGERFPEASVIFFCPVTQQLLVQLVLFLLDLKCSFQSNDSNPEGKGGFPSFGLRETCRRKHLDFNDAALEVVQHDDDVIRVCRRVCAIVAVRREQRRCL